MLKEIKKIMNKVDKTKYNDFEKLFELMKELGLLKLKDQEKFVNILTKNAGFKKRLEKMMYIPYGDKLSKEQIKKDYNQVGFKIKDKEIDELLRYNKKYRLWKKEGEGKCNV